ncbi:phosphatase PAP2 family protein [Flammeovirga pectinis]|uniref:Phosphatase PAP2 family protein n=1 Tax=Flammeovirga pectinis TaxID=2494373 RepID=A0A3Q9FUS1_9BACT|nr:phosphatase PAP2 family protein [Flammeovirga pectinis]AZQ65042.1 phosphatase PAP2 family protein [Flammeovirga pectinis]
MVRILFILFIFSSSISYSQDSLKWYKSKSKVYYAPPVTTASIAAAGLLANYLGIKRLNNRASLNPDELLKLNINDVNSFDRNVFNYSVNDREDSHNFTDWGLYISVAIPFALFIDPAIREDWLEVSLMYLETQMIAVNIYNYLGPGIFRRYRPITYMHGEGNPPVEMDELTDNNNERSFFSGHTSNTACGTFFAAKVLTDYHPEWSTGAKVGVYVAAFIPPALVGYYRTRAYKHFYTDVITGCAVGALTGVFVPQLHKHLRSKKNKYGGATSFMPIMQPTMMGLYVKKTL